MPTTTIAARSSAGEGAVLPQPPAERYIPKATAIDPDFAVHPDRHEGRGAWAARVPVLKWFIAR